MKYAGSAMTGLAQGLQTGLDWGMKMNQIKWEVAQKKRLETEQQELDNVWATSMKKISELYDSGMLPEDKMRSVETIVLELPRLLQKEAMEIVSFKQQGERDKYEEALERYEFVIEAIEQYGTEGNIDGLLSLLDADPEYKAKAKLYAEYKQSLPQQGGVERYPTLAEFKEVYGDAPFDVDSDGYYRPKYQAPAPEPTGVDVIKDTKITMDFFHALGEEQFNRISQEKGWGTTWKQYGQKYTPEKPETPQAPAKMYKNTDDYFFGSMGIIPKSIQDSIEIGEIDEEEKATIIKNHNMAKGNLSPEDLANAELYLRMIGIETTPKVKEEVIPEIPPEKSGATIWNPKTWIPDEYGHRKGEIKHKDGEAWEYIGDNKWQKFKS